jgi:serine/threonine protein kinase
MQLYFNHSNILRLFGLFDDSEHIYLVLEYMEEGTLYGQLKRSGKFTEEEASSKMKDVVEGVKYLHNVDVAHRDIKPENIVISNVNIFLFSLFANFVILVGQLIQKIIVEIHFVVLWIILLLKSYKENNMEELLICGV